MKRNVIQLAGKTLVISLPARWTKLNNIKKGDELDIQEEGNKLSVHTNLNKINSKETSINIQGMTNRTINWTLSALYKKGYDIIEAFYDSTQIDYISNLIKNSFIGYAIVDQTPKKIIIKGISQDILEEYKPVLRRAFLVTISMGQETISALKNKEFEKLNEIKEKEKINNQLTNFCQRIINKKQPFKEEFNTLNYIISWNLEKIADEYRYICEFFYNKKPEISEKTFLLFEETNKLLEEYYTINFKFNLNDLNELSIKKNQLEEELKNYIYSNTHANVLIASHLLKIVLKCSDFSTTLTALNQDF
ncbi:MAG TPA: phosphate uptake regulator PhoU [Candidatus Nanoarchaeia archaeon]|nr:phosphate uptake regulator PhoU [Candidatus Nanoarchaeia archaeon]